MKMIKPIIVLTVICLIASGALVLTNNILALVSGFTLSDPFGQTAN